MQSFYPAYFEREMSCTEADWMRLLPLAIGPHAWTLQDASGAVQIGNGVLALKWQTGAPCVMALMHMPRLLVSFRFAGVDEAERHIFMKRFDLYMQRGGG